MLCVSSRRFQALELLCPAVIVLLIGSIKNAITTVVTEEGVPVSDTPVATYGAIQNSSTFPNVLCYDNNMLMRYDMCIRKKQDEINV